ncbi:MAG: preprotein translocase subunit YajC [Candidatus Marinimicrobia bacterium]|nr:preprotein translocase subunit YajC [Candidatus Neomarinimicrobiota bacterium]
MLSIMLQAAEGAAENRARRGITSFLPFILIIVILWFLIEYMPTAQTSERDQKNARKTLQPKDKVVAIGGIIATIREGQERYGCTESWQRDADGSA